MSESDPDHAPPFDTEGVLWLSNSGNTYIPTEFRSKATVHSLTRTVVNYEDHTQTYETGHPGLRYETEEGDVAFLMACQHHGDDEEWHYYEVVPTGEEPRIHDR